MAMNREQKRALQKAGQLAEDGTPIRGERRDPAQRLRQERTSPGQFVREVRSELRKVGWPTRKETARLSTIVFVAIVIMTAFIFAVDLGFNEVVDFLYPSPSSLSTAISAVLPLL